MREKAGASENGTVRERARRAAGRLRQDGKAYWGFGAAFLLYDGMAQLLFHAFCPSVIVAGLPCPGCGMTRAVALFLTGRFAQSIRMNPLAPAWLLWALAFAIQRYWRGKRAGALMYAAGAIVVAMAAVYVYRMYRFFPGQPPICYTPGSILERLIPGYRALLTKLLGSLF
ncbi:MAG: DUF2752 domain-containing protein [Eubacteriales bacterium]|nr:DUF2752 domain-containing protein [Eubacteriales bacterium]